MTIHPVRNPATRYALDNPLNVTQTRSGASAAVDVWVAPS
jgi:hypothetical protein